MNWIPNPTTRGGRRQVEITDRAKRYRAQDANAQPEKRCIYCGAPAGRGRRLDVEHINGTEADNAPENLAYSCRGCNTCKGAVFARLGRGVKTRQYNPVTGARTLAEWLEAVMSTKGYQTRFTVPQAVAKIRATPPGDRSAFAHEIWDRRRERGGKGIVPF